MGQRLGSVAVISGCFLMLVGISLVPAALSQHHDEAILSAGFSALAFGALIAAAGFYLKTRALQLSSPSGMSASQKRGGCDMCHSEVPAVLCRVHNLHLCGGCLSEHYDFRSCVCIPSTRRGAASKPAGRAARA
jgi:hypothetical protein